MNFEPTNTLTTCTFDVLKIDGLEDPLINTNRLFTMDFEENCFEKAVCFINETDTELTNHKDRLYRSISESSSETKILESFSDYFTCVNQVIDKFLIFMNDMFSKNKEVIVNIINSHPGIKDAISIVNDYDESFEYDGFEYTFTKNIPLASAVTMYNGSLLDGVDGGIDNSLDPESIDVAINQIDFEDNLSRFRASVIGKEGESIPLHAFGDELFKVYRGGESTTKPTSIGPAQITQAATRFTNSNVVIKSMDDDLRVLEKCYRTVSDQLKEISRRNGDLNARAFLNALPEDVKIEKMDVELDGATMSGDLMCKVDIYTKIKVEQIKEYSNIHALAYAAKFDALKECYKQDANILYYVASKLKGESIYEYDS